MKKILLSLVLLGAGLAATPRETLTITQCYELARLNYPLIRQYALIDRTEHYNLSNAAKGWLPQLAVNAKASYQSEVTKLPLDTDLLSELIPGFSIPVLHKDQYQVIGEINQAIWDGGMIHSTRELIRAQAAADREQLESDLYALNERVNQLYFGCLLQEELLRQNAILQKELHVNIERIAAMIRHGVANDSDRESLEVELLHARQQETELQAGNEAYRLMLGALIGRPAGESVTLDLPANPLGASFPETEKIINRPELRVLEAKDHLVRVQNKQVGAGLMPHVGVFVQGGYGRPGLNMLEDSFEPFYVAGIRLSWNIGRLYSAKNDRRKIENNRNYINMQRELFIFNTSIRLLQQNSEIKKMQKILKTDREIVKLRTSIRKSAEIKLTNGLISVTDLIREINAEDLAKQVIATHRIQELMSVYNYIYTTNNQ